MKLFRSLSVLTLFLAGALSVLAQAQTKVFSRYDTLRGTISANRAWWDVNWYGITVKPDIGMHTIEGTVLLDFTAVESGQTMQIDLQSPMEIKSVSWKNNAISATRDSNVYLLKFPSAIKKGARERLEIKYSGKPREARNAPWDGGWIWRKDRNGSPWASVACQGLGASVWFPCKDHQSDEPDSASLTMIVPDTLVAVSNGRLRSSVRNNDGTSTTTWAVSNPINSYNIIPYIGKYVNWTEKFAGEKGQLDCSYWVLDYNADSAKKQFTQARTMLKCFERWFGPYPFYEDGYKLVESPHLGMEHQSAVAYGNRFRNGYLGSDLSGTGWGLKWDFIIVHESGHEWFGNNITSKDIADMWVHESFTNYSETLFVDCEFGKEAGNDYVIGTRSKIVNREPIIGKYGVNEEGSGDMYYKGGNMLHTIRQVINNDELFRQILRGLNSTFYHKTVTAKDIQNYISTKSGRDFSKVLQQYLEQTTIPELEYKVSGTKFEFRWTKCINGFDLPVKVNGLADEWLKPTTEWKAVSVPQKFDVSKFSVDRNFYVRTKAVN
jgi:aminopeptidase N